MRKEIFILCIAMAMVLINMSYVYAGVGIKWSQESFVVPQGERTCVSYQVYNPWPEDSYASISVSEELGGVLLSQEAEQKLVPANTFNTEAIPLEFCFEVPIVYNEGRDCWVGDSWMCEQECSGEQKIFEGEVIVSEAKNPEGSGGSGGSATSMSVSAPLRLKALCVAQRRDMRPLYVGLAVLAGLAIMYVVFKRYNGKRSNIKSKKK